MQTMPRWSWGLAGALWLALGLTVGCGRSAPLSPQPAQCEAGDDCASFDAEGAAGSVAGDPRSASTDAATSTPAAGAPALDDMGAGGDASPAEAWRVPLDHLPSELPDVARVIDVVAGPGADLWVLAELGAGIGSHLLLDRFASDGSRRWAEPWISDRNAGGFGTGPQRMPAGWLVVDDQGRATVAGTDVRPFDVSGTEEVWLTQLSIGGEPLWDASTPQRYVTGLAPDTRGGVYGLLGTLHVVEGAAVTTLVRFQGDGTQALSVPLDIEASPPVLLVPGLDDTLYIAGMRAQIFGVRMDAFVERYRAMDGEPMWAPPPAARDVRDYTGVVAAVGDGEGGVFVAVSTDLPTPGGPDLGGPGYRELRRLAPDGQQLWSSRLRGADGSELSDGFADWRVHLASRDDGSVAVAYAVGARFPRPQEGGAGIEIRVDRLAADGSFIWDRPRRATSDARSLPAGLTFADDGGLYLVTAPDHLEASGVNWLSRIEPD